MTTIALLILVLMAVWLLGGIILRLGGVFLTLLVLFSVVSGAFNEIHADTPYVVLWLLVGVVMWLAGHWHFAVRHGNVKSPLADIILAKSPGWLDPLHRKPGGTPQSRPRSRGESQRQEPLLRD
ncbi:MAG TPA: hypothetical protein VGF21_01925 [Thermoleophilaceae bacterium]|jgi:hypothetical protein